MIVAEKQGVEKVLEDARIKPSSMASDTCFQSILVVRKKILILPSKIDINTPEPLADISFLLHQPLTVARADIVPMSLGHRLIFF